MGDRPIQRLRRSGIHRGALEKRLKTSREPLLARLGESEGSGNG